MPENRFEYGMASIPSGPEEALWKKAIIEVADTAYLCRLWLETYTKEFTAADVLAMTRMVMDREDDKRIDAEARTYD